MGVRIGGLRRKARNKISKNVREKGKIKIKRIMQSFNLGDKVVLKLDPSFHKSYFHARFNGKPGFITGKRGSHYIVEITDSKKKKQLIVHPVHLKKI